MGFFSGGGSTQESNSFSGLDPKALGQWDNLFSGYQQGIAPWQKAGFDQAMKTAGSQFSGLNAARGGYNPFTGDQIASSAMQQVVPQFALANSQSMNDLMGQRQIATSRSFGKTTAPGIGYTFGSSLASSLGDNLGKWAAPGGVFKGAK